DSAILMELKRQGLEPDAVPSSGQSVLIQRQGNVAIDVTDLVHPEVARTVVLAARIVGLDVAGVDLVAEDISRPLEEQGGAIVEVNAGPGLLMHLKPAEGQPRPVGKAIINLLFPNGADGRIPVVGITGATGKTATARMLAYFLNLSGRYTGLSCSDGFFLNNRLVENAMQTAAAPWESAQRLLMNRQVQVAVIENGAKDILTDGLAYDRCQVGIVTNTQPMADLSRFYIETPEQMFNVLRTQVDVILSTGVAVLNAADPLVVDMARFCDGEVVFFAENGELALLEEHCIQGGRAVFIRAGSLVFSQGGAEDKFLEMSSLNLPPEGQGNQGFTENLLAAVAGAWALGLTPDVIRAGLETFQPHIATA
ncbi:MAG: Mur ligase family protein, partial [Azovibrio sp.]